jgi:hypothetical protein
MDVDTFRAMVERLTGTPVKDVTPRDTAFLEEILQDDNRQIDWSQLNELLLMVNKDRVGLPFFTQFFNPPSTVSTLPAGVERFQTMALRRYGNFIYAYRKLSRVADDGEMESELGECATSPAALIERFQGRSDALIQIEFVERQHTPLVGYLSAGEIVAERGRAVFLQGLIPQLPAQPAGANWGPAVLAAAVAAGAAAGEQEPLRSIIANYQTANQAASLADFAQYLNGIVPQLTQRQEQLNTTRDRATRNQDIYLTWDHMDVYFATSMRKRWEFEDLFDFVSELMESEELTELNIRHFDPTQSYTADRINKGLVESLMLKRAKCTVYSVQDTDTLGKDSELAATLAQGKPVIAYVPQIVVADRVNELLAEDPVTIQDRLRFVIYADEYFAASLTPADLQFVQGFHDLEHFERQRIWRSLPDQAAIDAFRLAHHVALQRLCQIIAVSEARIYDKRAGTLTRSHPLAVQVNLDTGVANGVLVVRTIENCAQLLRRVLTNAMEFELQEDNQAQMWYLRETISGCVFRVVSKDRKLTNCFWNFYLRT